MNDAEPGYSISKCISRTQALQSGGHERAPAACSSTIRGATQITMIIAWTTYTMWEVCIHSSLCRIRFLGVTYVEPRTLDNELRCFWSSSKFRVWPYAAPGTPTLLASSWVVTSAGQAGQPLTAAHTTVPGRKAAAASAAAAADPSPCA